MRRSLRERSSLIALVSVLGVLGAACVQPGAPKVGIDKVEASLVFGVELPEEQPPTPVQAAVQTARLDDVETEFDLTIDVPPPLLLPKLKKTDDECPTAPPTAAARDAAPPNVEAPAPSGLYQWKGTGFVTLDDGTQRQVPRSFHNRLVRQAEKVDETTFRFQTVQPAGDGNVVVSHYEVYTDKLNRDPTAGAGTVNSPVRVGEPDRGLVLTKIEVRNRQDQPVGTAFEPVTPLLMLPLPVTPEESWKSAAVDPKSGQSIVHEATARSVRTVDACGELVIGWLVEAVQTGTLTTSQAQGADSVRYDYLIATQYGGVLIEERLRPNDNSQAFDLTFTVAQVDPSPMPEGN